MRIKHFSGYGCVSATKKSKTTFENEYGEKMTTMVVLVRGNHERGLELNYPDAYDAYNWLLKRFDKSVKDYRQITSVKMNDYFTDERNPDISFPIDVEECEYTITYRSND